jgi:hypothetical protein
MFLDLGMVLFVVLMYLFYRKMQTNALRGLFKESKEVTFA